ncbi:MAG: hypothetical protein A3C36_07915 [Omnitrophica WOR_2 bacterium RIFCSPHIGHO2_02_FULL_52_10]|nr:MAG: hypothetical protein A3C36_07915 [Omnitrophica WOR_2 bacterium RIFCSPHIGHO2_02_FULL_52_10]
MSSEAHDLQRETKKYMAVFGGLLILTVVTVLASGFRNGVTIGVIIALIIAGIKGGLVACNFMHLTAEKKLVYMVLLLAFIVLITMMALICSAHFNVPEGLKYVS